MQFREVTGGGFAEGSGTSEDRVHRREVVAGGGLVGVDQADDDGRHDEEDVYLVSGLCKFKLLCSVAAWMGCSALLDGLEERRQLELGEHDGLVAAECAGQADDYEAVDVGERKKAQSHILAWSSIRPLPGAS